MNPEQLRAAFEKNKGVLFGVAAAGVGAFALYRRHTAGATAGSASSSGTSSAGVVPYSGGGQTTTMGGAAGVYDSTSSDLASFLSPQLGALQQQVTALQAGNASPTPVPAPIASTLLAPTGSGNYFKMGSGMGEIESDGSLFVFTAPQWQQASKTPGYTVNDFGAQNLPNVPLFSTAQNIVSRNTPAAAAAK